MPDPIAKRSGAVRQAVRQHVAAVLADPRVVELRAIVDSFGRIDGDLLAAGLALRALVAALLLFLLLVGISGYLFGAPDVREAIVRWVLDLLPPLATPVGDALTQLAANRFPFSIVGLVGLLWGASSFYGALDVALGRVFPGGRARGFVERLVRGAVTVVLLVAALASAFWLNLSWSAYAAGALPGVALDSHIGPVARQVIILALGVVAAAVGTLLLYRLVPTNPPCIREATRAAIPVGLFVGILTDVYVLLIPLLVGGLRAYGAVAAVIGALVWLTYVFYAVLMGGILARRLADRAGAASLAASEGHGSAEPNPADGGTGTQTGAT